MARLKYWNGSTWAYLQDGTDGADGQDAQIIARQTTADQTITFVNTSTYHNILTNDLPAINLEASTAYELEIFMRATQGNTSTAKALRLDGGTCTFTRAYWSATSRQAVFSTISGTLGMQASDSVTGVNVVSNAGSTDWQFHLKGLIVVNAAGTFMPKLAYVTADPTGTILFKTGTYVSLTKIPYYNTN